MTVFSGPWAEKRKKRLFPRLFDGFLQIARWKNIPDIWDQHQAIQPWKGKRTVVVEILDSMTYILCYLYTLVAAADPSLAGDHYAQ